MAKLPNCEPNQDCLTTLSSVLMLIVTLALSAQAQQPPRFSDWSAPVNLGSTVNTSVTDG